MRNSLIAGAAATFLMIAGNVAMAQQQPVAAPDAAAPQQANPQQPALPAFPQPDWSKLCAQTPSGKDACQTIRDLRTPDLVMSIQVSQEKGGKPIMNVMLPTGMVLAVGARVVVDGQTIDTARYKYCQGPYCFADLTLTDANLASLKKGKKLTVQVVTVQGQAIPIEISLEGFGKTFDGAGVNKDTFQADQKAYADKLNAIFQPFIEAQQKAQQQQGGPAAPAPTPAPAPDQPAAPAQ
jgi:invasion protein IalB